MTDSAFIEEQSEHHYRHRLRNLQIELVKFQRHLIEHRDRILVLFEGRDAAGKDGTIEHIVEHLSPRDTRVAALRRRPAASSRNCILSDISRICRPLPSSLFNRSWYNRAGVERAMGFCSDADIPPSRGGARGVAGATPAPAPQRVW